MHVLTWAVIRFARNKLTPEERTRLLQKFDSSYAGVAGGDKAELFRLDSAAIMDVGLYQEPLSTVLEDIYSGFGHRYGSLRYRILNKKDKEAAEVEVEKLETHEWLLGVLQKALENDEWKDARDGRVDQEFIPDGRYLTAGQERKRKSMLPEYETESDSKRCKRC